MAGGNEDPDPRPAVLILAPMRIELQPLVRVLRLRRVEAAGSPGRRIYRGTAGKLRLVATTAGIGTAASAAAAREMLDAEPFDRVVVCGVAGGIGPGTPVGSVIVPQAVREQIIATMQAMLTDEKSSARERNAAARLLVQASRVELDAIRVAQAAEFHEFERRLRALEEHDAGLAKAEGGA